MIGVTTRLRALAARVKRYFLPSRCESAGAGSDIKLAGFCCTSALLVAIRTAIDSDALTDQQHACLSGIVATIPPLPPCIYEATGQAIRQANRRREIRIEREIFRRMIESPSVN